MTNDDLPRDLVALFHCSFHPTKGNEIDWSLSSYPELSLEGVEFATLPSGLHNIGEDVIYFSRQGHHGVCVFRKRETSEEGLRGARLGALGILVAKGSRPMPWLRVTALRKLSDQIDISDNSVCPPPFARFFETNKSPFPTLVDLSSRHFPYSIFERLAVPQDPIHSFPKFLAIFGPSAFTIMRCVLAEKRIMVHAHPSTEAACLYAVAVTQICAASISETSRAFNDYEYMGVVGLFDIERLVQKSKQNTGWIACTTDRIFLEKPHLYDVAVDLPTLPSPPCRPSLFASVPTNNSSRSAATHRLERMHFTLSELMAWSHIQTSLSSLDASGRFGEVAELFRDVPMDWSETIWMALIELWSVSRHTHGLRLTGGDDDGRVPSKLGGPLEQEDDNLAPRPRGALLLDGDADRGDSSHQIIHNIVKVIQLYIASFDARASSYSPTTIDEGPPHIKLLPSDISSFGLNPLSSGDAEFCRILMMANIRRRGLPHGAGDAMQSVDVQVTKTWHYILAWLGWS